MQDTTSNSSSVCWHVFVATGTFTEPLPFAVLRGPKVHFAAHRIPLLNDLKPGVDFKAAQGNRVAVETAGLVDVPPCSVVKVDRLF
jgi:hypothetical protein